MCQNLVTNTNKACRVYLPDDYVDQTHDGFIQAVKEIPQKFSLSLHPAQSEAKGNTEDQQTQKIESIWGARHWYW